MVKIDLITGFLGSGKTTFIKKYTKYLLNKGEKIGILENDYGAINVDMLLLNELRGENCELEMVAGGCDADCHKRRFKTKLISMAMCGYTRVLVEPSGIFDVDEFFDVLREEPLDNWYEIGNVIGIVDACLENNLSKASDYLLASELSNAGIILFSKLNQASTYNIEETKKHIEKALEEVKCSRKFDKEYLIKDWEQLDLADFERINSVGYRISSYEKRHYEADEAYNSLYFMELGITKEKLERAAHNILSDSECGNVLRVKGFIKLENGQFQEINATKEQFEYKTLGVGQEVVIVIGEELNEEKINSFLLV